MQHLEICFQTSPVAQCLGFIPSCVCFFSPSNEPLFPLKYMVTNTTLLLSHCFQNKTSVEMVLSNEFFVTFTAFGLMFSYYNC